MVQDRLAAIRALQHGQGQGQDSEGEGEGERGPGRYDLAGLPTLESTSPSKDGIAPGSLSDFYAEITYIQEMIAQLNSDVSRISELHSQSLNNMNESTNQQYASQLDELLAETQRLSNDIKRRIETVGEKGVAGQAAIIRKNQLSLVRSKFIEALQNYQNVEKDYRSRYRQRIERQLKIVKPDATSEEITTIMNDTSGSGNQIFAQAIFSSNRYGESRAAYREVQDRHEDIKKIEQTMVQLAQLMNDMSIIVAQQDNQVDAIYDSTSSVEKDTEAANTDLGEAVVSARSARRKRWMFFWLLILILIIVAVIVVVEVKPWKKS